MKTARRRFAVILSLTILLIAMVALGWNAYYHNGSLVRNGHRIGQLEGQTSQYTPTPEWISDHEAVYLRYHFEGDRFEFNRVNTDTGVTAPISGLNDRYKHELVSDTFRVRSMPFAIHVPPNVTLSPALYRLLISPNRNAQFGLPANRKAYHVSDLRGSYDVTWADPTLSQYNVAPSLWLSDDNRWLISRFPGIDLPVTLFDVQHPATNRNAGSTNTPSAPWEALHITRENTIWGFGLQRGHSSTVRAAIWDFAGVSHSDSFTISLPVTGYVTGTALSAESDRVAWLIYYWHTSPLEIIKEHFLNSGRRIPANAANTYGIWVSDIHGNNMKELGHEQIRMVYSGDYIRWLPGGKKLAFHIGNELYTTVVDR